ncbi:MAG: hypothetical protein AB1608_08075 [Thermoproteota archaeon]
MSWDSIISAIGSNIIPVVVAIITAMGSIIGIIITQYLKTKQEIKLKRENDLFDRKQKAYRDILKTFSKMHDHSYFIGSQVNWKIMRYVYNEILLIGSKNVVTITNDLLTDESPDSRGTNEKMKKLYAAIREDLYGEQIPVGEIHITTPSTETVRILALYNSCSEKLKAVGIDTPEKASEMNEFDIAKQTGIDVNILNSIKNMTKKEFGYENDLKNFLENN